MSDCPEEHVLLEFVEGTPSPQLVQQIQHHLDACPACTSLVVAVGGQDQGPATASPAPIERMEEYRLLRPLGQGAMGQVYLAHDTLLDRPVAIKFLSAMQPDAATRHRFFTEARAIARLNHPNVVTIHRVGEADGRPYLVSELVRGRSLDRIARPLPWQRALEIGIGLARGLGAAHRRGVLHRDIKPANAILADDGEVKLLDFGLAKLVDAPPPVPEAPSSPEPLPDQTLAQTTPAPALTRTGAVLGTPVYMAPETWRGEPATRQTDIYSLGALLYELCSGREPHQEKTLQALRQAALERDVVPLAQVAPGIDTRLADVVDRCLRRDPAERYAAGDELCLALERLAEEPRAVVAAAGNPYRGLYPFEAKHRALFFGRTQETRQVLEVLRAEPVVLVVGDSGVGKSSLCRAGVVPLVREGALGEEVRWIVEGLVPGRHPLVALADALGRAVGWRGDAVREALLRDPGEVVRLLRQAPEGTGLLLFIDQMEELLTQSEAEEAARVAEVLGHLYARPPRVRVLMTGRGDYLVRLAGLPGLGPQLPRGVYILRPLGAAGLREAIEGPASAQGVHFESGPMVHELVDSTRAAEGGLPLLQFALAELWEGRDTEKQLVPAAALLAIGGVGGALSRHADQVLAGLLPAQRKAARRMLMRLVTVEGVRVRRGEAELVGEEAGDRVALEALVRGRLLVARAAEGETAYEVAHEALVQGWGTLREWLNADVEARALRERAEMAAAEWVRLGRARDALWSEAQIAEAEALAGGSMELPPQAEEFLAASQRHVVRSRRTRRGVVLGLTALPLLLGLFALQWQRARDERRRAERTEVAELGVRAASLALLQGKELDAMVAAVQSLGRSRRLGQVPPASALEGLSKAVPAGRRAIPLRGHSEGKLIEGGIFSPDGLRIATASNDGTARLWDGHNGKALATLTGHTKAVTDVHFSPDGQRIVTASLDGTARMWDGQTGRPLLTLSGHTDGVEAAIFSPDGTRVLTASRDGSARTWDAWTGTQVAIFRGPKSTVDYASFSRDGRQVFTVGHEGTMRWWDARSGNQQAVMEGPGGELMCAAVSPDETRIVTANIIEAVNGEERHLYLWDARTRRLRAVLRGHSRTITEVSFSPDGSMILTAEAYPGRARLWDGHTGALLRTLEGHENLVNDQVLNSASFSLDGKHILTSGIEASVRLWDVRTGECLDALQTVVWRKTASFSPDGQRAIVHGYHALLWRPHAGIQDLTLEGQTGAVHQVKFSTDGRLAATANGNGFVQTWDARTGHSLLKLPSNQGGNQGVEFSPDGQYVSTTGADGSARIWSVRTGRLLATLGNAGGYTNRWSPDGRLVLTVGSQMSVWEWRSGRQILAVKQDQDAGNGFQDAGFSADGTRVFVAFPDVQIWDVDRRRKIAVHSDPEGSIRTAAFSPDGQRLLTGGTKVQLRDARTGSPLLTLSGHLDMVDQVRFAANGARIMTASEGDGSVRIWDAHTGQMVYMIQANHVFADISPDGRRVIISNGRDAEVKIYPATAEAVAGMACELLRYQPEFVQVREECQPYAQVF